MFKTVPEGFYSILDCRQMNLYRFAISEIYNLYQNNILTKRETVNDLINNYIRDNRKEIGEDKTAADVIRLFVSTGWLEMKYDAHECDDVFSFTDYAMAYLRFQASYDPEKNLDSNNALVISKILEDMFNDTTSNAYKYPYRSGLSIIYNRFNGLIHDLRDVQKQLSEKKLMLKDVKSSQDIATALSSYMEELKNGYIANIYRTMTLTTSVENLFMLLLDDLQYNAEFRNRMIFDMAENYKYEPKTNHELECELDIYINKLSTLFFKDIHKQRDKIEKLKNEILEAVTVKIYLVTASNTSNLVILQSIFDKLNAIEDVDDELLTALNSLFKYDEARIIEPGRLYQQKETQDLSNAQPVQRMSNEELEAQRIKRESSIKKAKQYCLDLLGNNDFIEIANIEATPENVEKLKLIYTYADDASTGYLLSVINNEKIKKGDYMFSNCRICKVKKNDSRNSK